jgi:hypothetical protein
LIFHSESFFPNLDVADRRKCLNTFDFYCQCDVCNNNEAYLERIRKSNVPIESPLDRPAPTKSYAETVQELKANWKYIQDHAENILTWMNYELMSRNFDLLYYLAKFEVFPHKI